ncbi:hypothetical protein [Paenibacillus sp. LHD-38]|uniref:hypothetical protein n=1 Tax=Paenibacillus sp. LHD-38 TaxID=3072143 RepID=UPI00280DA56E|nr:hypothetical protein [Paenibacillus sp. LHD-38]MDQ8734913.1 hypothetical protein [Paenibacillus sp. LHD-38]
MNIIKKSISLALSISIVVATTAACSKEETPRPSITPESTEPQKVADEPKETTSLEEASTNEDPSLESIATKDAENYLDALKKEDLQLLSSLMAHAENEYTPETMKISIEGFRLHFDTLTDLRLSFESNEQNEDYFIENFLITGMKKGEVRSVPFQIKYSKSNGTPAAQDDDHREPLYVSPLIDQYPHVISETERYLQAILQEDAESLILHLGLYNQTEEDKATVRNLLKAYGEQLDLTTTKAIPVNYNEEKKLFLIDFQDKKESSHRIQVDADTSTITDDWASDQ